MAAVYVHLGQDVGMEPANVPDETGVGPLGVAPQLAGRNSSNDGVGWTSGIGSRQAPDQHSDLLDGTAKAQLPMLLTKSHLSPGRLSRVRNFGHTSVQWMAGWP